MKFLILASLTFCLSHSFAATEAQPEVMSKLLTSAQTSEAEASDALDSRGSCENSVACPDGAHTAYCKATGPYTRCTRWGAYGVRCVAWNNSGKSTVASQVCP